MAKKLYQHQDGDAWVFKTKVPDHSNKNKVSIKILYDEEGERIEWHKKIVGKKRLTKAENEILEKALNAADKIKQSFSKKSRGGGNMVNFIDYAREVIEHQKNNNPSYKSAIDYLEKFSDNFLSPDQVDLFFLENYMSYLKRHLARRSTRVQYFERFGILWNHAFRRDMVDHNPFPKYRYLHRNELKKPDRQAHRLTKEQLKLLEQSDLTVNTITRKAFLWACYTGQRYSDVIRMRWQDNINFDAEQLVYAQKKTGKRVVVDLSPKALDLLETLDKSNRKIFPGLPKASSNTNVKLRRWAKEVGLNLPFKLSFHKSRHTAGSIIYNESGDIELTKEILGHSSASTTSIYAKVNNKRRREVMKKAFS